MCTVLVSYSNTGGQKQWSRGLFVAFKNGHYYVKNRGNFLLLFTVFKVITPFYLALVHLTHIYSISLSSTPPNPFLTVFYLAFFHFTSLFTSAVSSHIFIVCYLISHRLIYPVGKFTLSTPVTTKKADSSARTSSSSSSTSPSIASSSSSSSSSRDGACMYVNAQNLQSRRETTLLPSPVAHT